ncbi:MAG: ABC transporter substrate-binding protein, partial [bacterium]
MVNNKTSLLAFVLIGLIVLTAACASKPAEQEEVGGEPQADADVIKIGVFEPMTGDSAAGGQMTWEGIELANELHGEVLGKKVELVLVDNKTDKNEAANAAIRLVEK